jgi:hypothetical protein
MEADHYQSPRLGAVLSVPKLQLRIAASRRAGAIAPAVALWSAFAPETARASTHVSVVVLASTDGQPS